MRLHRAELTMAQVIVTLKIMPAGPDTPLAPIQEKATRLIHEFGGQVGKIDVQEVAFGLKALNLFFMMDEDVGSTESLEQEIATIEGVNSVDVTDVRRALG
jgi:elongation factor 1-beta